MPDIIYVLGIDGKPQMPTTRRRHVEKLLNTGKARIAEHVPFTIQLLYENNPILQPILLAEDPGRTNIGVAVLELLETTKVVFTANVETRNKEIPKLMRDRKAHRMASRGGEREVRKRKAKKNGTVLKNGYIDRRLPQCEEDIRCKVIRNTEAKFCNRQRPDGWLTPTAEQLVRTHINILHLIGHNTDAVCSIMKSDGTVLKRKFVDFPSEKDLIHRLLNRINKKQSNKQRVTGLWQYTKFLNDEHAKDIARCVVDFATKNHVNVIVMERLNFKGKKYGDKAQILSMWNYGKIQAYIEHRAHRNGIRISRICARNTSQLAFDGSGKLVRDKHNMALATFSTGKQYNCDLNASYNIGARYFIREIPKSLPETTGCSLKAKVPMMNRRTSCTLSTLWQVNDVLSIITSAI